MKNFKTKFTFLKLVNNYDQQFYFNFSKVQKCAKKFLHIFLHLWLRNKNKVPQEANTS